MSRITKLLTIVILFFISLFFITYYLFSSAYNFSPGEFIRFITGEGLPKSVHYNDSSFVPNFLNINDNNKILESSGNKNETNLPQPLADREKEKIKEELENCKLRLNECNKSLADYNKTLTECNKTKVVKKLDVNRKTNNVKKKPKNSKRIKKENKKIIKKQKKNLDNYKTDNTKNFYDKTKEITNEKTECLNSIRINYIIENKTYFTCTVNGKSKRFGILTNKSEQNIIVEDEVININAEGNDEYIISSHNKRRKVGL